MNFKLKYKLIGIKFYVLGFEYTKNDSNQSLYTHVCEPQYSSFMCFTYNDLYAKVVLQIISVAAALESCRRFQLTSAF